MVGQANDRLLIPFVADLRPSEHDLQVGTQASEDAEQFERGAGIPDIDAQPEDLGGSLQQGFRDLQRALVDVELQDLGPRLQLPKLAMRQRNPKEAWRYFALRVDRTMSGTRKTLLGFLIPVCRWC